MDAVLATQDSLLLMENAVTINIVELMDILNMVNAIAMMDFIGFLDHASHVELTKLIMVLFVNALLAILEMLMEIALNLTSTQLAIIMKDLILHFKHVFALMELNISEVLAEKSQLAQKILIMMVFNVFAHQDLSIETKIV